MGEWLLAEEQHVGIAAQSGGERGDEAEPVRRGRVDGQKTRRHYSYRARISSSLAKIALTRHASAHSPAART